MSSRYIQFLKEKTAPEGFINKLKCYYRPIVVPMDKMMSLIKPEDKVFDIGCGNGQFCGLYAEFCGVKTLRGIEISQTLITAANQLFKNLNYPDVDYKFETFDGSTFPDFFKDTTKVILNDVLHHVPKNVQEDFLINIFNQMESGSTLILKDINAGSLFVPFNKVHDLVFAKEIGNEWSLKRAKEFTQKIGFELIEEYTEQTLVYPHYILVLKKN